MSSATQRRELLKEVYEEARDCVACQLHRTRTTVVFGAGDADADLMFVGEAPGANEDRMGLPFVGQAGKLLDRLLSEIGMERGSDVFIMNVLKCRPPDNRDPHPHEIEACQHYLFRQLDLIQPTVVCTLGNFATKLLRRDTTGISRVHGQAEVRVIGPRAVRLLPLYHPAAALYTPSTLETLRADFQQIPALLALGSPPQPEPAGAAPELDPRELDPRELDPREPDPREPDPREPDPRELVAGELESQGLDPQGLDPRRAVAASQPQHRDPPPREDLQELPAEPEVAPMAEQLGLF